MFYRGHPGDSVVGSKSKILFLEPKILRFEVSCDTFCDEFENSCFNLSILGSFSKQSKSKAH